ncbi:hypothetical protein CK203_070411 [Vitis vinifera]|uniref:Uncharacterized protein n=1 Tax=Vitis vinifera TaxID=29760 RepID=A0A438E736_VITVI|nr:hypothetical protein CK203_070411 [Vitis vinifera]
MSANQEAASSGPAGDVPEKSVDKLSVKENSFTLPRSHQPSSTQYSSGADGCSILNMLFNLDLSLLEVLFVYSLKKGKNDIFSMAAHLPSLQLVTELPDSMKGGAKGYVVVRGAWAGLLEHPERPFSLNYSLVLPGSDMRGHVVEWVEKASFVRLNKLFEITAAERQYVTLLTARNLMAVVREPCEYIINILPRKLPKKADAEKRRALLVDRERRKKEGTLRKAPGKKRSTSSPPTGAPTKKKKKTSNKGKEVKLSTPPKEFVRPPITYENEVTIKEPENPLPPSISSGPGHVAGLNHSGPSLSAAARLALLAEEAASINTPGSPIRMRMQPRSSVRKYRLLWRPQWRKWGQKTRIFLQAGQAFLPSYR